MRSMTGFGSASAEQDGTRVTVEITAVNSKKQADIRCQIPRELSALETEFRKRIQQRVVRGNLNVSLQFELGASARQNTAQVDTDIAEQILETLREFALKNDMPGEVRMGDLLQIPGIVSFNNSLPCELLQELAVEALDAALETFQEMREVEGQALYDDLKERGAGLTTLLEKISVLAEGASLRQRDRLRQRILDLGVEIGVDDERLAKEIAFLADKADITEEIVRLRSHFEQYGTLLEAEGNAGRKFEFLSQEMNREITTIGSKSSETEISNIVIDFKAELGRIREQIMNVE